MEALACGLPILCSDIRGNRDLIINNINGVLIENQVEVYIKEIEKLINNKILEQKYNISENLSIEKIEQKIKNIYTNTY